MTIESVQEYLTTIELLNSNYTYTVPSSPHSSNNLTYSPHFIYRGHSNHQYELLPGAFRWKVLSDNKSVGEYSQLESNILYDFISHACRYTHNSNEYDIQAWLEIAQHFGVPTRLLDFTENPLIALFFACTESFDEDASVSIINEPAYNKKFFSLNYIPSPATSTQIIHSIIDNEILHQDYKPHVDITKYIVYPWIYTPNHREERMSMQASVFMLWGAHRFPLNSFIEANEYMDICNPNNKDKGILGIIQIPKNRKLKILAQLESIGISDKTVYPGLDGVGKYIKHKYSYQA